MSLYSLRVPGLSIGPLHELTSSGLRARDHPFRTILTLGAYGKRVEVNARLRRIRIDHRRWWLWRSTRSLRFDEVSRILYEYSSSASSWGLAGAEDAVESFDVGLELASGERIRLYAFVGEGSRHTGWPGVLVGDDLIDAEGDQDPASRRFVRALSETMGVSVGTDTQRVLREIGGPTCPACERANPPRRAACQYCGAPLDGGRRNAGSP